MRLAAALLFAAACGGETAPIAGVDASIEATADAGVVAADAALGLTFTGSCLPGDRLVVAAVGDVLLHGPLQTQAYRDGFGTLWSAIVPLVARAGTAYANLEGPVAAGLDELGNEVPDPGPIFDDVVYTGFPRFNYHASVIPALRAAGFAVVSTANNHATDRGAVGVDRTLDALAAGGLPATGTRRRRDDAPRWYVTTDAGGFRLAWLACTFSTNDPDTVHQVLECDTDGDTVEALVRQLAARSDIDAVLVTPHGGDEYSHEPALRQRRLAARVLDAGALAVFGNHPHVVQPWEKRLTADGRETFVIYSVGNFVSGQAELDRQSSLVLYLGLLRRDGKTRISWVGYVPTTMQVGAVSTLVPATAESAALVGTYLDPENALSPEAALPVCR